MTLNRAAIERNLPHAGKMVLLDAVLRWDENHIECVAAAPTATHPLARQGIVPAIAAAEYAAQAMAVHAIVLDGQPAPAGMLAKLSDVALHATSIPVGCGPLAVRARLLGRGVLGCLYAFEVDCVRHPIASGRLMIAFARTLDR